MSTHSAPMGIDPVLDPAQLERIHAAVRGRL